MLLKGLSQNINHALQGTYFKHADGRVYLIARAYVDGSQGLALDTFTLDPRNSEVFILRRSMPFYSDDIRVPKNEAPTPLRMSKSRIEKELSHFESSRK